MNINIPSLANTVQPIIWRRETMSHFRVVWGILFPSCRIPAHISLFWLIHCSINPLGNDNSRVTQDYFWFPGALQGRKCTWRKFMTYRTNSTDDRGSAQFSAQASTMSHVPLSITQSLPSSEATPRHQHSSSAASSDTEYTNLDMQDLWLPDCEPTPSTLSALHQFGKEMLRLSSGLQNVTFPETDFMADGLT